MKIALYSHLYLPNVGGAEIQIHNLATALKKAGHEVFVFLPWSNWSALGTLRRKLNYRALPLLPKTHTLAVDAMERGHERHWLVGVQLRAWQRLLGCDVWHVHGGYPSGALVVQELTRMSVPAVLTCHGEDIQTLPAIGYGVRLERRRNDRVVDALQRFDGVIAISRSIRDEYAAAGVAAERTYCVPNGVDVPRIQRLQVDRDAVRRRHGVAEGLPVLLTIGRNHPKKGYHLIPAVAAQLKAAGYEFEWWIAGRGAEQVVQASVRAGLGGRIRALQTKIGGTCCLDSLPGADAIELYKSADVFVFPTLLESFGLVVVEAMAAGLPVVASAAPGVSGIIDHDRTGLLVPIGDPDALALAIARLLDDPQLGRSLAAKASQAAARYAVGQVAKECVDVYREVKARKAAGVVRQTGQGLSKAADG